MKKLYIQSAAIVALLAFTLTTSAQRHKMVFVGGSSTNWQTLTNWTRDGVLQNNTTGVLPQNGDSIVITSQNNASAFIAPGTGSGTYTFPTSGTLNNVILIVQSGAVLQFGNGGQRFGVLNLDNASAVSLEGSGASAGKIKANPNNDSKNVLTLGGVIKYESDWNFSALNSPNGGLGTVSGPARATSLTGNTAATSFALGSLPVLLSGFNANLANGGNVNVRWTTQQEANIDHFDIQRSSNGLDWQTLATVKASGFSSVPKSYTYADTDPQKGTNLYRLKMVDIDAAYNLSGVVNVRLAMLGRISLYPNPVVNVINISLGAAPSANWTVSLFNTSGQAILQKTFSKDQTTISLPVKNYPTGNYTVEITDGVSRQSASLMIAHQ